MATTNSEAWFLKAVKRFGLILLIAGIGGPPAALAQIPSLSVVLPGGTPVEGYRWLIEEDRTHHIQPGSTCNSGQLEECLSIDFHRSYMPVVAEGDSGDALPDLDPSKRYFVSILPYSAGTDGGASLGGAPIAPGQAAVEVVVNELPIPTAQIRVFAFEDNFPINNAPDLPEEHGLAGFKVLVFDAAGRYGVAGGQVVQDAYGNPLGTTYDGDGNVIALGDGNIYTGPDGYVTIKNLAPGKYGIQVVPPAGAGWQQTSTIEGSKTVDAWVKANEPAFFTEFGPPGPHVFIGFVNQNWPAMDGEAEVHGRVMNIHGSRPPEFTFYTGAPFPSCWVGLNDLSVGTGKGLYAAPCNADSTFSIPNVPPGNYQLAIWDTNLDAIFGSYNFSVAEGQTDVNLLDVPVFNWFARIENYVFNDVNENGFWDEGESPIPEQNINLRWRDGTIYQAMPTDMEGAAPFEEVFPFFSWLVAEVDFARFKATGATVVVDAGGPINASDPWSFDGWVNPQPQSENGGLPYRTETGPVLTQAFQAFLGQTSVIQWGKTAYAAGENGGISGMVFLATTRAEDDPRYAAAEEWEPGIPRIQVALYQDADGDGRIDDLDGNGQPTVADVDNHPFGWRDGGEKGPEDFDYDEDGSFDPGDAIQIVTTDSWDDNLPTNCQGEVFYVDGVEPTDCYDGLRNFNQVRPGVFDGGYAFDSHVPGGLVTGNAEVDGLPTGTYIVATGEHPVYKTVKEEDKNVDFGDTYTPQLLPPVCVGEPHTVPDYLSFQTDSDGNPLPGVGELIAAPYAGESRPLCDRKQIGLADGRNAAVDFFLYTRTPPAGHVVGFILDDLSNEFDPNSPTFGEKFSPPYLPVSIRDWTGREITRTYSDRWGRYNALIPSTYTNNLPMPSGVSPNMLIACMNSPGPIEGDGGNSVTDPFFNRQYSQFCYTFQYMPGTTTYLDTPVVPVAAFAGPDQFPLDCEFPDGTPMVWSVAGSDGDGLPANGPYLEPGGTLTVTSAGPVAVNNPAYGEPGEPKTIQRDFGFGSAPGSVTIGGEPLEIVSWTEDVITAHLPRRTRISSGQLEITRGDNNLVSRTAVTVTVGPIAGAIHTVQPGGPGATPIQDAIDAATAGDLILVAPGSYEEKVIMWKPVQLQGSGAATVINAVNAPGESLQAWRDKVQSLVNAGAVDLLPAQEVGFALPEPETLATEEGAGVLVLAKDGAFTAETGARIDGFSITGSDNGGGIVVNGYADYLAIGNNRIYGNHGVYGGGIRVGHPNLVLETDDGLVHQNGFNDHVRIHHNWVSQNGSSNGVGGGVSLVHGADYYQVTENAICGNFTQGDGAGIGHLGVNDGGLIRGNDILFNQSFNQGIAVSGGGIYIGGAPGLGGPGSLSPGAGSVRIEGNRIQGNQAGAGDGGGIRLAFVNGQDVEGRYASDRPEAWYRIDIFDNLIVNNVAGFAGGALSLQDAARVNVLHNTIVNNDSTATAGAAFEPGNPNRSTAQPAGIVAYAHSPELAAAFGRRTQATYGRFSNPRLANNIIRHNRSFHFEIVPDAIPPEFGLSPDIAGGEPADYWDMAVLPAGTGMLTVDDCGAPAPEFVAEYFNGERGQTLQELEFKTSIQATPAFDEGGNFIDVHFGPLTLAGDYHLTAGSPGVDACLSLSDEFPPLADDFDGEGRPAGAAADIGADEVQ